MAEEADEDEKTEDPTPRKREKAREDGQTLTSREMMVFANLALGAAIFAALPLVAPALAARWAAHLRLGDAADLDVLVGERLRVVMLEIGVASIAVALPLALAVIAAQGAMGGLRFTPKSFSFQANKLDPMKGLGRMVSRQALAELIKALAKVAVLGAIGGVVMRRLLPQFDALWSAAPETALPVWGGALMRLLWPMVIALGLIGAGDLFWQWFSLNRKLRMTRHEIKEESKESNGSPEVKGRMRQIQAKMSQEAGRARKALADVPRATAIVTNPIHFAIAIRYVPGETAAPVLLARGRGPMAAEIVARGRAAGVQVTQSPLLARALFYTGELGAEIDEGLYTAVAAVLAHVWRIERGENPDLPDIDLPGHLRLDPHGRPLSQESAA